MDTISICHCTEIYALAKRVTELERIAELTNAATPGLARFADKWWIVTIAYVSVILPWGIMHHWDFISEKWRTVHRTRFLGRLHLAIAIIPMPFIIFYAHLQQISQDYKEMMAAVVAICMSLYHVLRTCWGLMQVANFSNWCSVLFDRMQRMEIIQTSSLKDKDNFPIRNVNRLLVNNTVVDNELGGTDLTIKIAKSNLEWTNPSSFLKVEEKQLCVVRWSGTFLSSFAQFWSGSNKNPIDELFSKCTHSLDTLGLVTFPVNGKKTSFSRLKWNCGGPYNSSLHISHLGYIPDWLKHRKRALENLMSGFPACFEYRNLRRPELALVSALLYAQSMDDITFDAFISDHSKRAVLSMHNGWNLLLWQHGELPSDFESGIMDPYWLPPFPWQKLMVPLWDDNTNWRVFQASVHVDNCTSLYFADIRNDNVEQSCWFEYIQNIYGGRSHDNPLKFVGSILESVRTFLARWISFRESNSTQPNWRPRIPTGKVPFWINQDITFDDENSIEYSCRSIWRWEFQSKLHEIISGMDMNEVDDLPSTAEMIFLFILGFPGFLVEPDECSLKFDEPKERNGCEKKIDVSEELSEGVHTLEFRPGLAPQNIKLRIQISRVEGKEDKKVEIELVTNASVTEFDWESWINSAMGFIKAEDDANEDVECGTVPWRKRTPRKADLSKPLVRISLPALRGHIHVWTGWPFFDIKIVQFEINEWMRASGCLRGYCEMVELGGHIFEQEARNAEDALMKICEWPDSKWGSIAVENENDIV